MAAPFLAKLAPREPELVLAKSSWAEDRPLCLLQLLDLGLQSLSQFQDVGQTPKYTHPGSAGCRGPTHSHLYIPTRGQR